MILTNFAKRAYIAFRSVSPQVKRYPDKRNQAPSDGARIDACVLENRLLFSATLLGSILDGASDPPLDANDLPDQWLFEEDYSDGNADLHESQSGTWEIVEGRYRATGDGDAISTMLLDQPLPANLELSVTFNADDVSPQHASNGFIVFDYHGPTDFKFAGAFVGFDEWVIGHRSEQGWVIDQQLGATIDAQTDYDLRLTIVDESLVTLYVGGRPQLTHTYTSSVTDGQLGLGTNDAISRFDDFCVRRMIADTEGSFGELPLNESFDDLTADHLQPKSGSWLLVDGSYQVSPAISNDGVSQLLVEEIPDDVEIGVTINADELLAQRFSNGFVIFDYHGPTDFKYAGGFFFRGEWAIGQRTSDGWVDDVVISASLDVSTDYDVRLVIEDGAEVSLYHADDLLLSHVFEDSVTDGSIGLGSNNSITSFDNFSVVDQTPQSSISAVKQADDLVIAGDTTGSLQIVGIANDTFQILDGGRLISTVKGVTGNLRVELGDADDDVTLDLGGRTFRRNVAVDLGGGANNFEILDGSIRGHLKVKGGDGQDEIRISDDVAIGKHVRLRTGAGEDSFVLSGKFGRGLFLSSGDDNDSLTLTGSVTVGLFANMGDGDDHVQFFSPATLGRMAVVKFGDGDDTFTNATSQEHVLVMRDRCDRTISPRGWSYDRHGGKAESDDDVWKGQRLRNALRDVSHGSIVHHGNVGHKIAGKKR